MRQADRSVAALLPARLVEVLATLPRLAVACSGGLDSRFLCHAATLAGCRVLAVHARGPHVPAGESEACRRWAASAGVPLVEICYDPLALPEVAANSRERCYACKRGMILGLRAALAGRDAGSGERADAVADSAGWTLCDGGNADDAHHFRPGMRAVAELGVRSPLAGAGLGKAAIRALAAATGLERPEQAARPCLLTRLAYGLPPDKALLARLDAAEAALAQLAEQAERAQEAGKRGESGFGDFRLRLTPEPVLQARRLPAALRPAVDAILVAHGFTPWRAHLGQCVSGFFDRGAA